VHLLKECHVFNDAELTQVFAGNAMRLFPKYKV
jgi:hypothetical protein